MKTTITALECFSRCSQQYVYQYVNELQRPKPNLMTIVGTFFHKTMEKIQKRGRLRSLLETQSLPETVIQNLIEDSSLKDVCLTAAIDPILASRTLTELLLSQFDLERIWHGMTAATPIASEAQGTITLGASDIELRLDRIDQSNDGVWFIDYKTQATIPNLAAIERFDVLQPWLYSLYGFETYNESFLGFVYFLPECRTIVPVISLNHKTFQQEQNNNRVLKNRGIDRKTFENQLPRLKTHVHKILCRISQQDWTLSAIPNQVCRVCAYRFICEVLREATP